jgi:predicted transcriptional regulator
MSLLKHHELRITVGLTQRDEYIVALLYGQPEVKTSFLYYSGVEFQVKDAIQRLKDKGLISVRSEKKRNLLSLTEYGREYVEQVKKIYTGE